MPVSDRKKPVAKAPRSAQPTATAAEQPIDAASFEPALAELEVLVDQLERGDLQLEASLAAFERGVQLTRRCQQALDEAEQRVRILTEATADAQPQPFTPATETPP